MRSFEKNKINADPRYWVKIHKQRRLDGLPNINEYSKNIKIAAYVRVVIWENSKDPL